MGLSRSLDQCDREWKYDRHLHLRHWRSTHCKTVTGTTTRFVYDRGNVYLEFSGNSATLSTRYLHGPMVDQVLAQESNGQTTWMLTDHLGSVRDLVNNSGAVVNHFTYDSFGQVVGSIAGATADTRYKFTGREYDSETGLYYYRARYFDAGVGRFIGQDPLGFGAGDKNLYRYVGNSPLNATDPSGKFRVELRYISVALAWDHADVVVTDNNGRTRGYWAHAEKGGGSVGEAAILGDGPGYFDFGKIRTKFQSPYTKATRTSQVVYFFPEGAACPHKCIDIEAAIIATFKNVSDSQIDYNAQKRNSNSVAFQSLENALPSHLRPRPKSGVRAPAWNINPFTGQESSRIAPVKEGVPIGDMGPSGTR